MIIVKNKHCGGKKKGGKGQGKKKKKKEKNFSLLCRGQKSLVTQITNAV